MAPETQLVAENIRLNREEHLAGSVELRSFPHHIQIGADNRCNLRCGFCLAASDRELGRLHIQDRKMEQNPAEIFERLTPYMRYWDYLSLTGPGESLLNPKLDHILGMIRSNSDCTLVITTNGVLINKRLAKIFLDNRVSEVSISMDSLRPDVYAALRINGELDDVLRAIDLLNAEKARRGVDTPRLNVTPNFSRRNIEELPAFIDFAHENGISVVQATPTQVYRRSWIEESLLNHRKLTRKVAETAEQRAAELGVNFSNGLRMVYWNDHGGPLGFLRKSEPPDFPTDPSTCLKPWSSIYIEPDGEVRPCCYQSPILGNIYERTFEEIWNGNEAQRLRRSMIEKHPPEQCRQCYDFNRHDPSIMIQIRE